MHEIKVIQQPGLLLPSFIIRIVCDCWYMARRPKSICSQPSLTGSHLSSILLIASSTSPQCITVGVFYLFLHVFKVCLLPFQIVCKLLKGKYHFGFVFCKGMGSPRTPARGDYDQIKYENLAFQFHR